MTTAISIISTIVVAFITSFLTVLYRLGRISSMVESTDNKVGNIEARLEKRLDRIEDRFDKFFLYLNAPVNERSKIMEPYIHKLDEIIEHVKQKGNPVSADEIDKFKAYRNKIVHGVPLTIEEYNDFKSLTEKVKQDLPENRRDDFDLVIAGLLGFILGLTVAALLKK